MTGNIRRKYLTLNLTTLTKIIRRIKNYLSYFLVSHFERKLQKDIDAAIVESLIMINVINILMVLETNVHLINLFDIDNITEISRKPGMW